MIRLSTKGRYGARLMLDLAVHNGEKPVLLKDVAKRQDISYKYLEHIASSLKAAKLVEGSRGARGGYRLSRKPAEITLAEVIHAIEGKPDLVECVSFPSSCCRASTCVTHDLWKIISQKIEQELSRTTLKDMMERHQKKNIANYI